MTIPVLSSDIEEYLASTDDFAFEREVYNVANGLGFDAEHAALYTDPVTSKPRQFDIRASITQNHKKISLAIECKGLSQDFPLLVSCVPRPAKEAFHQYLYSDAVMGNRASYTRVATNQKQRHPCIYPAGQGVGKSMRQVRRETRGIKQGEMVSGDDVFDKWMQALGSISEMIQTGANQLAVGAQQPLKKIAFLPVLVVSDKTLWIADYSSRGELQGKPFQIDSVEFFLGRVFRLEREDSTFTVTHLHITTRTQIRRWLAEIANGGGIWEELFE